MIVGKGVIVDLLPVYLAGDASPETVALVEAALQEDPLLASIVRESARAPGWVESPNLLEPDVEVRSLRKTRAVLAAQRWLFALAITFTVVGLSLSITFGPAGMTNVHPVILDNPVPFGASLVAGFLCWIAYWISRHRFGPRDS